ncbi:hypothetical protein, partial [Escherichia coli]|uniref:hypothetical protein n=2 Tax=Escherichia coli TaxID=562 RepID=UPI001BC85CCB
GWTGITIDDCWKGWAIFLRQKQKKFIMLPSETMIWQPEFTDKTLSRKTGAVHGIPEALQAADSRLIAERHANGSWWTVEGYHEANDPRMPEPEDALNVDEARGQLEIFFK